MNSFAKHTVLMAVYVFLIFGSGDLLGGRKGKKKGKQKKSASVSVYTPKEGDVTVGMSVEDKLSGTSKFSYAMSIERLMLFYKIPVNQAYMTAIDELKDKDKNLTDFGSVDSRMEAFVQFSQKEGRKLANLKIRKLYCLNDFQFKSMVRRYNECAKKTGKTGIDIQLQSTHVFNSGFRSEFLTMDKETRKAARLKDCQRIFVKSVKMYIDKKTPIAWTAAFGDSSHPSGGLFLIVGYNDNDKEIIYYNRKNCQRVSYEDAWGDTTGLYIVMPRVVK